MKRRKRKSPPFIYYFTMLFMSGLIAMLVYLINGKTNLVTLTALKEMQFFDVVDILTYQNLFNTKEVVNEVSYSLLKDDYYANGSNEVINIYDGVILQVEEDSLFVLCDNGLYIQYSGLSDIQVMQDERILSSEVLGAMQSSVQIQIIDNDIEITLAEALSLYEN